MAAGRLGDGQIYSSVSPRSIVALQKDRAGKLANQSPSRYHGLPIVDIADITYSRDMLWGISPSIRGAAGRIGRTTLRMRSLSGFASMAGRACTKRR